MSKKTIYTSSGSKGEDQTKVIPTRVPAPGSKPARRKAGKVASTDVVPGSDGPGSAGFPTPAPPNS